MGLAASTRATLHAGRVVAPCGDLLRHSPVDEVCTPSEGSLPCLGVVGGAVRLLGLGNLYRLARQLALRVRMIQTGWHAGTRRVYLDHWLAAS